MTLTDALNAPRPAPSAWYASLDDVTGIVVTDTHGALFFLAPNGEAVLITPACASFLMTDDRPPVGRIAQSVLADAVRCLEAAQAPCVPPKPPRRSPA